MYDNYAAQIPASPSGSPYSTPGVHVPQVAANLHTYVFDVLELAQKGQTETLRKCIGQLLTDGEIVKVFHDLRLIAFILLKVWRGPGYEPVALASTVRLYLLAFGSAFSIDPGTKLYSYSPALHGYTYNGTLLNY